MCVSPMRVSPVRRVVTPSELRAGRGEGEWVRHSRRRALAAETALPCCALQWRVRRAGRLQLSSVDYVAGMWQEAHLQGAGTGRARLLAACSHAGTEPQAAADSAPHVLSSHTFNAFGANTRLLEFRDDSLRMHYNSNRPAAIAVPESLSSALPAHCSTYRSTDCLNTPCPRPEATATHCQMQPPGCTLTFLCRLHLHPWPPHSASTMTALICDCLHRPFLRCVAPCCLHAVRCLLACWERCVCGCCNVWRERAAPLLIGVWQSDHTSCGCALSSAVE